MAYDAKLQNTMAFDWYDNFIRIQDVQKYDVNPRCESDTSSGVWPYLFQRTNVVASVASLFCIHNASQCEWKVGQCYNAICY